ncbi:hypothetical protein ACWGQT_00640 [Streptomyces yangpuensis]
MNATTREDVVEAAAEEQWSCNDCWKHQERKHWRGRTWYDNSGWYRVLLRPDAEPVHLCERCFRAYDEDWPEYVGTWESSAWQSGSWEGKWLWALPADYFERREAYRKLPRWGRTHYGWELKSENGIVLGRLEGFPGDARKKGLYRPLDSHGRALHDGSPRPYAEAMEEVLSYLQLDEGQVRNC